MATIKAGTYRFNDVLTAPSDVIDQSVNFTLSAVYKSYSVDLSATCDGIYVDSDSVGMSYHVVSTVPDLSATGTEYPLNVLAYLNGWNLDYFDEGIQTITIPTDQEVSAEFAEWFTANAVEQKQISGKWKFKDVLSYAGAKTEYVNFTASVPVADMVIVGQCDCIAYGYNLSINVVSSDPDISAMGFPLPLALSVYDPEADIPWEYDLNYIDFGTEPQTVSAEFYNWLTANATQPMASVSHNGEEIASLFPGQTATLKCAGMKMATDVVVSVAEQDEPVLQEKTVTENGEVTPDAGYDGLSKVTVAVEANAPVMQTLEVNITEPGIFEFTPDAGYDGIIKVVVGVDAPQLTAPNISLDGDTLTIEATDENTETFAILVDGIEMATVANEGV